MKKSKLLELITNDITGIIVMCENIEIDRNCKICPLYYIRCREPQHATKQIIEDCKIPAVFLSIKSIQKYIGNNLNE